MERISIIFLLVINLFSIDQTNSQTNIKFKVECKFTVYDGDFIGFTATLIQDSTVIETIQGKSARSHTFLLDYNHKYLLKISKDGYVSKSFAIITTIAVEKIRDGFKPYKIQATVFKQPDDKIVEYTQPVAVIYYNEKMDNFDYDTDYTKFINEINKDK